MIQTTNDDLSYKSSRISPEIKNFIFSLLSDVLSSCETSIDSTTKELLNKKLQNELYNLDTITLVNENNKIFEELMNSLTIIYNDYKIKCKINNCEFDIEYIKNRNTLIPPLASDHVDILSITSEELIIETIDLFKKQQIISDKYKTIADDEVDYNSINEVVEIYNTTTVELNGQSCTIKRMKF